MCRVFKTKDLSSDIGCSIVYVQMSGPWVLRAINETTRVALAISGRKELAIKGNAFLNCSFVFNQFF